MHRNLAIIPPRRRRNRRFGAAVKEAVQAEITACADWELLNLMSVSIDIAELIAQTDAAKAPVRLEDVRDRMK